MSAKSEINDLKKRIARIDAFMEQATVPAREAVRVLRETRKMVDEAEHLRKKESRPRSGALRKNPRKKRGSRSKYKHKKLTPKSRIAAGSFRTVKAGKARVVVGCPKGKYSKRSKRCKVGTKAVTLLTPNPQGKTFRVFAKKKIQGKDKFFYWTGDAFDSNYTLAHRFTRKDAIKVARGFARKFPNMAFGVSDGKA
jgi:hypothetical protein